MKAIKDMMPHLRAKYTMGLLAVLMVFVLPSAAQISEGGVPYSFTVRLGSPASHNLNVTLNNPGPIIQTDTMSGDTIRIEQQVIGEVFPAGVSPTTHGTWNTLANGDQLWRLKITSNAGEYMMLLFNDFYLPQGTSLFVYSEDRTQLLGAFTSKNNTEQNKFTTTPIKSNALVLEYYKPKQVTEQEKLSVQSVGLITRDLGVIMTRELGESADCMINAKCSEYEGWCNQRRSVALIIRVTSSGQIRWCSGSLLTNERRDGKPFFLTAFHCLDLDGDYNMEQPEKDDVQNWLFVFNYQSADCSNPSTEPPMMYSISGSTYINSHYETDYAVLQLNQKPPRNYNSFYNSWSNDKDDMTNTGTIIHHPAGDIKKISAWDKKATLNTKYWKYGFTAGSGEGGSSGAPFFNSSGYVVGQVKGAANSKPVCDDDLRAISGRFDKSWHDYGLSWILNPNGTHSGSSMFYIASMSGDETCKENWYFTSGTDLHTSANVNFVTPSTVGTRQYDGVYNAKNSVTAEAVKIQPATRVTFEGGHNVLLKPGFEAKTGSIFSAAIADCERGCGNGYKKKADEEHTIISQSKPNGDEPFLRQAEKHIDDFINVYPNTSSGIFTVELRNERTITEIRVYDLQGRLIKKIPANSNKVTIDITSQPAGLYLLHVVSGSETGTSRVIVTSNK